MTITCSDRDRIFADGSPAEWAALEAHAAACASCAEELRAWRLLSVAARELRDYSDSPALWPRIQQTLAEESARALQTQPQSQGSWSWRSLQWLFSRSGNSRSRSRENWQSPSGANWNWASLSRRLSFAWQTLATAAIIAVLAVAGLVYLRPHAQPAAGNSDLLKTQALENVERAETAYVQAIDRLAVQAKPEIDNPATPLLASYREKLQLLDSAIGDLRAQAGMNPSNAHLRYELLAMYQEKQRTLEEILENK